MKTMKVFDCQDMPQEVRAAFFERNEMKGNDCYVNWYVGECDDETYEMYGEEEDFNIRLVDEWLRMQTKELDSEVLIQHWW